MSCWKYGPRSSVCAERCKNNRIVYESLFRDVNSEAYPTASDLNGLKSFRYFLRTLMSTVSRVDDCSRRKEGKRLHMNVCNIGRSGASRFDPVSWKVKDFKHGIEAMSSFNSI